MFFEEDWRKVLSKVTLCERFVAENIKSYPARALNRTFQLEAIMIEWVLFCYVDYCAAYRPLIK